jgi:lysophospholipase L1-like esterase
MHAVLSPQEWAAEHAGFAHYADFGRGFLSEEPVAGRYEVKEALMPDSLHPSAVGMRIIASQLEPLVRVLVEGPVATARGMRGSSAAAAVKDEPAAAATNDS